MANIKVSVITVVYNSVDTIERTINSVLGQTYSNLEYIIIDGGSTDGTLEVITNYETRMAHVVNEPDNGMYDAMNKGIKLATGELIGIINGDDWYEPNAVELMVNAYSQNQDCSIFHGLLRFVDKDEKIWQIAGHPYTFLKKGMIEHPTCFVHKKVYEKLLFNLDYSMVADYDFMLRANENGFSFCFVEQIIANFRSGGMSGTFQSAKETLAIQKKYKLISRTKQYILTLYFWLKLDK